MSRWAEIVVTVVWTALLFLLWVVTIAVILLPLSFAADWWLGEEFELLAHPRRNALVLGAVLLVAAIIRTFTPPRQPSSPTAERAWWRFR